MPMPMFENEGQRAAARLAIASALVHAMLCGSGLSAPITPDGKVDRAFEYADLLLSRAEKDP
jgi:hypothetical protein